MGALRALLGFPSAGTAEVVGSCFPPLDLALDSWLWEQPEFHLTPAKAGSSKQSLTWTPAPVYPSCCLLQPASCAAWVWGDGNLQLGSQPCVCGVGKAWKESVIHGEKGKFPFL